MSDTFRRDHLGTYGHSTIRTPHLDRFAQKCTVFDRYYANSFPTVPARADLFTGKYTYTYLGWSPLPAGEKTLAQVLAGEGYSTMAVVDTPFLLKEAYNYDRGFQDFIYIRGQGWGRETQDTAPYRRDETDYPAAATMHTAEQWLQRHYKEKFFLYVDTWDPHEPWNPPRWYTELYYPGYDGRVIAPCYCKYQDRGISEDDLKIAHANYCGEVTMVDRWVGRLLDTIEALKLMENTLVIFTSDHGFYFGEHGYFGKAHFGFGKTGFDHHKWVTPEEFKIYRSPLYEELTRIPMFVYAPGFKPKRSQAITSLVDIPTTILDVIGMEIPDVMQGESARPALEGEKTGKKFTVTSWPLYNPGEVSRAVDALERGVQEPLPSTIITEEWALIYGAQGYESELYHLPSDPKQSKNLVNEQAEQARDLHHLYLGHLKEAGTPARFLKLRQSL
jgi:arylsulfatase A-like enzyme